MAYRAPINVEDYIKALGDPEVELRHTVELSKPPVELDLPILWGEGPETFSVCTDLARPADDPIWDANGYYRSLGFSWPYRGITKAMLMRAYRDRGGANDTTMTYAFKQLLNPAVRAEYDATPLGEEFYDEYVINRLKAKAKAYQRENERQGIDISDEEALAQFGLGFASDEEESDIEFELEREAHEGKQGPSPTEERVEKQIETNWYWSFYVERSPSVNLKHLATWQRLLLNLLSQNRRHGRRVLPLDRIAVGVFGYGNFASAPRTQWRMVDGKNVFFIRNDVHPDTRDAKSVIWQAIEEAERWAEPATGSDTRW